MSGGGTCGKAIVSIGRNMAMVPYGRHIALPRCSATVDEEVYSNGTNHGHWRAGHDHG